MNKLVYEDIKSNIKAILDVNGDYIPLDVNFNLQEGHTSISLELNEEDQDIIDLIEPLMGEHEINDWGNFANKGDLLDINFSIEFVKEDSRPIYYLIPELMSEQMKNEFAADISSNGQNNITLRIHNLDKELVGEGILLTRWSSNTICAKSKTIKVPTEVGGDLSRLLFLIQKIYLAKFLDHKLNSSEDDLDIADLISIQSWIESHGIRKDIYLNLLKNNDQQSLSSLLLDAQILESDMVEGRAKSLTNIRDSFKNISTNLLSNLDSLRTTVISGAGQELFQSLAGLGLILIGTTTAGVSSIATKYTLSVAVSTLFLIGFLLKIHVSNYTFNNYISFYKEFHGDSLNITDSKYQKWYINSINISIKTYYKSISIGGTIAFIPLVSVIGSAFYYMTKNVQASVGLFTVLMALPLIFYLIFYKTGPHKHLYLNY